jgi:hypothetical protein
VTPFREIVDQIVGRFPVGDWYDIDAFTRMVGPDRDEHSQQSGPRIEGPDLGIGRETPAEDDEIQIQRVFHGSPPFVRSGRCGEPEHAGRV